MNEPRTKEEIEAFLGGPSEDLPDAWKQYRDLLDKYTREREIRADLRVLAHACDRSVEFRLGERRERSHPSSLVSPYTWHTTKRNVDTMRELAYALLDACDFVDASNPTWAKGHANQRQ